METGKIYFAERCDGYISWRKTWSVPVGHMELEVRCLKNKSHEGSRYTRMFIVSASYSYFFLISPKICLMGMQPATSCSAAGPCVPAQPLAIQPQKARGTSV